MGRQQAGGTGSGASRRLPGSNGSDVGEASSTQPLLHPDNHAAEDPEAGRLLAGSAVTAAEVAADPKAALKQHPREAVRWLEERSCRKLGTLRVQASCIPDLQQPDSLRVFGAAARDLDWQREWRARLAADAPRRNTKEPDHSPLMEVEAWCVDIENPAGADDEGILNPLLHKYNDQLCGLRAFSCAAARAVMTYKWRTWARAFLVAEVLCYAVWLVSFHVFVLLLQDEDSSLSLLGLAKTLRGGFTLAFEAVALLAMLPFVFMEVCTVREYGVGDWHSAWNTLDLATYAAQVAISVMHVGRLGIHSDWFSVLCAIQVLLLWLKAQYFFRALQPTKNPLMETLRAVLDDIKWFLVLLLLTLAGFSMSFFILMRKDQEKQEFRTILSSLATMFSTMMGGFDLALYSKSHNPVVAVILLLVFVFIMSMVLFNALTGFVCAAAERVNDREGSVFLLARAQIIDELETTIPLAWRSPAWHPRYLHFLQLNRDTPLLAEADEDAAAEAESDPVADKLAELETRLAVAQSQIAALLRLQEALVRQLLPAKQARELLVESEG